MIRVIVSYPNQAGARFDLDYYLTKHMPMVAAKVGGSMTGWAVDQGIGSGAPGAPPEFTMQAHLTFVSLEAFQTAMATVGPEIMADIPNYTDIQPHIQVNKILSEQPARAAGA
jgi:uncharacterized protein (TIGR02118 family)